MYNLHSFSTEKMLLLDWKTLLPFRGCTWHGPPWSQELLWEYPSSEHRQINKVFREAASAGW